MFYSCCSVRGSFTTFIAAHFPKLLNSYCSVHRSFPTSIVTPFLRLLISSLFGRNSKEDMQMPVL